MAYGFGGRAYDDDDCWWQEDETTSSKPSESGHTTHDHQHTNASRSTTAPTNFHSLSHGSGTAYDDHNDTFSCYAESHNTTATLPNQPQSCNAPAYNADANPPHSKTTSSFATKPTATKQSNSFRTVHNSNKRKSAHVESTRRVYNTKRNAHAHKKPGNTPQTISNPAYRNQIGNKYRSGRMQYEQRTNYNRAARQRPEIQNMEQQQAYKEQLRNQTKAHLDESLRTAYQSEEVAADTSERLYYQRKQLENVDKMLHDTDQNLDRTEHTLKGMKSIWGGITTYFRKAPERQPYQKRKSVNADTMNMNHKMMQIEKERADKKNTNIQLGGSKEEDQEFNEKLDELHKSVKRMKVMAQNMNQELDDQGGLLQNIDDKMSRVDQRIHKQNYTINRIR